MVVQHEMLVGRIGEQAGPQRHRRPAAVRKVPLAELPQQRLIHRIDLPPHGIGGRDLAAMVVPAELEPRHLVHREPVEPAFLDLQVEHRERLRREQLRPQRLQPRQHLPLRHRPPRQRRRQLPHPWPGRQHQPIRLVAALLRPHGNAARRHHRPLQHRLARLDRRAGRLRRIDMGNDRPLARDQPPLRLEHRPGGFQQPVPREPRIHLAPRHHLMLQPMQLRRRQRPLEQRIVLRPGVDRPGRHQQRLPGRLLRLVPQLVGPVQQRHIGRVLVIRQPDDAADPVRGAHIVRDVEPLQPEHPVPTPRQVPASGAPHAAHADDDHIIAQGSPRPDSMLLVMPQLPPCDNPALTPKSAP